jgi:hypothetical protein
MKLHDHNFVNGWNKFRKTINNNHVIRKAASSLSQINNYALPVLGAASVVAPGFSPIFASIGTGLKAGENVFSKLKNKRI